MADSFGDRKAALPSRPLTVRSQGEQPMAHVDRFSVSLDTELLAAFDRYISQRGYENRSEAVRDLIRDLLSASRIETGEETVAAVLMAVCDHREGEVSKKLRGCITDHRELVMGSMHFPIDEHRDIVVIGMRGPNDGVQALAALIQTFRGISHGRCSVAPLGPDDPAAPPSV